MNATTIRHRVPFYETDAMGIVHHANYVRYLELARIAWMDEFDRPYREYVSDGFHFSTTRVEFDFKRSASFDDVIEITTWLAWVRGVSLAMQYELRRGDDVLGVGMTEHALVDGEGRPSRIPADHRERLRQLSAGAERRPRGREGRSTRP
jgi:acyl-CoA thioester hydrolase